MFDPVLVARSWVSATKWGPLEKLCGVKKKQAGPQFSEYRLQIESAWAHSL